MGDTTGTANTDDHDAHPGSPGTGDGAVAITPGTGDGAATTGSGTPAAAPGEHRKPLVLRVSASGEVIEPEPVPEPVSVAGAPARPGLLDRPPAGDGPAASSVVGGLAASSAGGEPAAGGPVGSSGVDAGGPVALSAGDGPEASSAGDGGGRRAGRRRWEAYALLELAAAAGVALAQPLLDVIGASPDFFLFYGAGRREALLMVAAIVLVPPLVLWLVGLLSGLAGQKVRRAVHLVTLGGLLTLLAVQVGKQVLPLRGAPLVAAAVAAGAALAAGYWKWEAVKQIVRLAGIGPIVFTALFVFASPASAVVLGSDAAARAAGGQATRPNPPIVMIIFDELPLLSLLDGHGNLDAQRYPNFAKLAAGSTWYRNATGVSGWTPYAVPAMLSGNYPKREVAPHYSQYPKNLYTLLSARYDLKVQESVTQLCPPRSCDHNASQRGGLPVMLGESAALLQEIVSPEDTKRDPTTSFTEPTVAEGEKVPTDPRFRWDTLDDNQPVRFRDFVTGLADTSSGNRPVAHVLHLLMPHTPWRYLPNGVRYDAPESLPTSGQWWPQLARQRHLLQLQYADLLLGETIEALRASGQYDKSLIAVTADHGVTFGADSVGRGMDHVRMSPAEVLWVPMLMKAPGQRTSVVDDRNWQHVDLLPTLADHAGVKISWKTDGITALGPARTTTDKLFYDKPNQPVTIDGAAGLAVITGKTAGFPKAADPPRRDLVGRSISDLPVARGQVGGRASVTGLDDVVGSDPSRGTVHALVYGSLPDTVKAGSLVAIVVNGKIGAVVPALEAKPKLPRFAGIVADPTLFSNGGNEVELYQVESGPGNAVSLRRVPL